MSILLNRFANGDTNYVSKHNTNADSIEAVINGILAALGTGASTGPYLNAIFGTTTAFIGSTSYTTGTSGTVLTVSSGYAWRPDLGSVLYKGSSTAIDFAGQPAATYYIELGADGTPARASSSSFPLYSVVWTGSAFGAITAIAPVVPGGDVSGSFAALVITAGAVTLAKMAALPADTIIGNNTGVGATPLALTPSQVATLIGCELLANKAAANGYASLDSGGKVPTSQLPASIVGGLEYQGTWDANANSPSITTGSASSGNKGYYYKISTAGATVVDGNGTWHAGDWIVSDGSVWEKVDNYEAVTTVAGRTGAITLAVADVSGAAPLLSPTLTGVPAAPTAAGGTNTTQLATTAFVTTAIGAGAPPSGTAGGDLTGTFPNPTLAATAVSASSYGDASHVASFSVDAKGRLTAAASTAIAIGSGAVSGLATVATSGSASDLATGTLPAARLPAIRYDVATYYPGVPGASQLVLRWLAPRAITIPSGATASQASAGTAATGSTTYTIKQNGSSVGTILWSAGGTSGAFTVASPIVLAAGDVLTITGPVSPDATIADIAITLAATA